MKRAFGIAGAVCGLCLLVAGCARSTSGEPVANSAGAKKLREMLERKSGGGEAAAAASAQPTGWSALSGVFLLEGSKPAPTLINVTSDHGVCAPGNQPVYSQDLVVGDNGGIGNVVIYARKVPEAWVHEKAKPPPTPEEIQPALFDQKKCTFLTHVLAYEVWRPVNVKNSDPVGHNTNIQGTPFNQSIPSGGMAPFRSTKPQSAPLKTTCNIHPWMLAYILPVADSYFAVTKSDGSFEISNLPAGVELEFQVWQERSGNLKTVILDGKPEVWKGGRFKRTLEPDKPQKLSVKVPVSVFQ